MFNKLILTFIVLFSLKAFSAEKSEDQTAEKAQNQLAKKQLKLIIKSIKEESTPKNTSEKI